MRAGSAFLNARGAPPPLVLARRLRAALGPQALLNARGAPHFSERLGPHPQARPLALGPQALLAILLLLVPAQARAEYTRIELKIFGMDCAICAHGIRVAIQKIDAVESVTLSLERAEADIRLRQENRVSLDQFRKIVKANGFEPRQATVTAVGTAREVGGKLAFEVSGVPTPLVVDPDRSDASASKQLRSALDSKTPAVYEITGIVEKKSDGVEQIAVASVNRRP